MTEIDYFEDQDTDEYDLTRGTGTVAFTSTYNTQGTYALELQGDIEIFSYDDGSTPALNYYPQPGDSFTIDTRHETLSQKNYVFFGMETNEDSGYRILLDPDNFSDHQIVLAREDSDSTTTLDYTGVPQSELGDDVWYTLDVDYRDTDSGTISVDVIHNGSVLMSVSSTDTTHAGTNVGLKSYGDQYGAYFDNWDSPQPPAAPSGTSASASGDDITVTWNDNSDNEDGFEIDYHYDGTWYSLTTVGANDTNYTHSNLLDGEEYRYRVRAYNSTGTSSWDYSNYETTALPAPSGVSQTVNNNASIDVSWNDTIDHGNYHVQVSRDGSNYQNPSGGPTTTGHNDTAATYTPNSDSAYQSVVGIDSSFRWRVRSETEHTNSGWSYSSTDYTDPAPPHNPTMSRPDANTFKIAWTNISDIADNVVIYAREDVGDGTGYGSWTWVSTETAGSSPVSYTTGTTYEGNLTFQEDARYQFHIESHESTTNKRSKHVYFDYGNNGNVFFTDDFEDQDLAEWTNTSLSDAQSGITTGYSPDQGSYALRLDGNDYVNKSLGDLSGESDVLVKAAVRVNSQDSSGEYFDIRWYDGSSWRDLETYGWEHNDQGWVEMATLVPSSWLATDNRVQFGGDSGGGGDTQVVDRVVVSDLLHEYTTPAAPSSLTLDTSIEDEITGSWTLNASLSGTPSHFQEWRQRVTGSGSSLSKTNVQESTSYTSGGLADGEKYDIQVDSLYEQFRHGGTDRWWRNSSTLKTGVTVLPAPTGLTVDAVNGDQADVSWTPNHDYGDQRVEVKPTDAASWSNDSGALALSTSTYTTSALRDGEKYDCRVVAYTEHTSTVDQ